MRSASRRFCSKLMGAGAVIVVSVGGAADIEVAGSSLRSSVIGGETSADGIGADVAVVSVVEDRVAEGAEAEMN